MSGSRPSSAKVQILRVIISTLSVALFDCNGAVYRIISCYVIKNLVKSVKCLFNKYITPEHNLHHKDCMRVLSTFLYAIRELEMRFRGSSSKMTAVCHQRIKVFAFFSFTRQYLENVRNINRMRPH